jgi:hypothetical protein
MKRDFGNCKYVFFFLYCRGKNLALKFGMNLWILNKDFGNCANFSVFMLQSEKLGTEI